MKQLQRVLMACMLLLGMFSLVTPQQAFAIGTASGTNINNSASIDYRVGGINQATVASPNATFSVDNKVDVTVANQGFVQVAAGGNGYILEFLVTNMGNTEQDYALLPGVVAGDDFDMNNVNVFVEEGSTAGYQAGVDTATFIDSLDHIAGSNSIAVYIVSDTPPTALDTQIARYSLLATTADAGSGGATTTVESNGASWLATTLQVVFADGTGSIDSDNDGAHSANEYYQVVSITPLTVTKGVTIISDPFSAVNPKAIPGAIMQYTISVSNGGTDPATSVVITDAIPTGTGFVVGSATGGTGYAYSNDGGTTWTYSPVGAPGATDTAVTNISISVNDIAAGASIAPAPTFRVEIQ